RADQCETCETRKVDGSRFRICKVRAVVHDIGVDIVYNNPLNKRQKATIIYQTGGTGEFLEPKRVRRVYYSSDVRFIQMQWRTVPKMIGKTGVVTRYADATFSTYDISKRHAIAMKFISERL